ncbi:MAG: hypothetical protein ACOYMA_09445 [Bacteroidia bacterium]
MKKKILYLVGALLLILSSCGDKSKNFEGMWQNFKEKNGNNSPQKNKLWIITKTGKNYILEFNERKFPALYNKEQDKLEVKDGLMTLDIIYDANTKHLFSNGNEYEKTCSYVSGGTLVGFSCD